MLIAKQKIHFDLGKKYEKILDHCLDPNDNLILYAINERRQYCLALVTKD